MNAALFSLTGHADLCADIRFDGATDRAIVRLALAKVGLQLDHGAVFDAYLEVMQRELTKAPFRALAGAAEVVRASMSHGLVGLGTGNLRVAAHHKVSAIGLGDCFAFGGYGDDSELRSEVLALGAARGAAICRKPIEACEVIVIGDTVRDIEAARAIGGRVIAVATGGASFEELAACKPDDVLTSLSYVAAALRVILK